ncbi:MAG: hypothetical protein U0836_02905 [Pirellulales bacterium]
MLHVPIPDALEPGTTDESGGSHGGHSNSSLPTPLTATSSGAAKPAQVQASSRPSRRGLM